MARPKSPLPPASAIMALADDKGCLAVRVTPNASGDAVILPSPGDTTLVVRTTVAPEDGKANEAVLRLLARALDRAASSLELVRGASNRNKLVRIVPASRP
jgi:uncharacterized protein YggU (UPF0235/DUF167 family)